MKKIVLGLLVFAGFGMTAMAQTANSVYTTNKVYTASPDAVYVGPAATTVVVPVYTETRFRTTYPNVTRTSWYRMDDDWYRVTYMDNGPWYTLGYYTLRAESYPISLPVLENKVPDEVVNAVMNRFAGVYDITETIGSDLQTQYIVRTIGSDGQVVSNRVNASAVDVPL